MESIVNKKRGRTPFVLRQTIPYCAPHAIPELATQPRRPPGLGRDLTGLLREVL